MSYADSHNGSGDDGHGGLTSPPLDGETSDDETSSEYSWASDDNSDGDAKFKAPEYEEIPSPRWMPFSPSRRFEAAAVNLEEVKVDNEVLDGILEQLLQAAGRRKVRLSGTEIQHLCAACGDRVVQPDLHSFLKVYEKLRKALSVKLLNLKRQIEIDTDGTLKPDASVDELTVNVVEELRFACQSWKKLLETQQKRTGISSGGGVDEPTQSFSKDMEDIAGLLIQRLTSKSESNKEYSKSQRCIYLLNNWYYIEISAGSSSSNELFKDCFKIPDIREQSRKYLKEAWGELATWISEKAREPLLISDKKAAKEKLDSFNKMFEKALQSQRPLVVSNNVHQANLRHLIRGQLLEQYTRFVAEYHKMEKPPKYFKYTPNDIAFEIDGLFGGSDHIGAEFERKYDANAADSLGTGVFRTPHFPVIGSTHTTSSGGDTAVALNNRTRTDFKNEGVGTSKASNLIPPGPLLESSPSDEVITDDSWLEGQTAVATQHSLPLMNSHTSDPDDLGGLEDSEDVEEPLNNHHQHQTDEIITPLLSALSDSTPTEPQQSSFVELQRQMLPEVTPTPIYETDGDECSEGMTPIVVEHNLPPRSWQTTSATALSGLGLQDMIEPDNNHFQHQTEPMTATSPVSAEMQPSSSTQAQRLSAVISPEALPRSSLETTSHKVSVSEPRKRGSGAARAAASKEYDFPGHSCSSTMALHEQVAQGAADMDDRSLHYTEPQDMCCDDDDDEEEEIEVMYHEEDAEANLTCFWHNTLSAYILGSHPNLSLDLDVLQQSLQAMWELTDGRIRLIPRRRGFFLVCFTDKDDKTRALEQGPWLVDDGELLVLRQLSRERPLDDEDQLIPLWVKIFGIPLELWDRKHLSMLGSRLGKPVCMDPATAAISTAEYARICVEVPLDFSFPSQITLRSSTGRRDRLLVEYDWKPQACKACNLLGHKETVCPEYSSFQ